MDMNAQMLAARNWLLHKNKKPFYVSGAPRSGKLDSPADRAKLATYEEARAALAAAPGRYTGLGFAINDGWQFVDLDKCRDPVTGKPLDPDTEAFVVRAYEAGAYVETSISGTGYHALGHGKPGAFPTHKGKGIETYCKARYMALGNTLVDGSNPLPCIVDLLPAWGTPAKAPGKAQATRKGGKAPITWPGDRKQAQTLLPALNPDIDYPEWIEIGMALHDASGGHPEGLEVWETWSRGGDKFKSGGCAQMWQGFKPGAGITFGTLVKMCRDASEQNAKWAEAAKEATRKAKDTASGRAPRKTRFTFDELMSTDYPATPWFVEGLLAPGLTLLAAPPKAGKSYLMSQMAMCVAAGRPFLGRQTRQVKVCYMNLEEWPELMQQKARDIATGNGINLRTGLPNLRYLTELDEGVGIEEEIERQVEEGVEFIIIDLLARIRNETDENVKKNAYVRDYEAMRKFADLILQQHPHLSITIVHHTNKGQHEAWQDKISGSQGLAGASHCNMLLASLDMRGKGDDERENARRYRHFYAVGKLVQDQELLLEMMPMMGGWQVSEKTTEDVKASTKQEHVMQLLREADGAWVTAKQLHVNLEGSLDSIKKLLQRMHRKNLIESDGQGGAGYRVEPDA